NQIGDRFQQRPLFSFALPQRFLRFFALGDIFHHRDDVTQRPLGVAHRQGRRLYPDQSTVLSSGTSLLATIILPSFDHLVERRAALPVARLLDRWEAKFIIGV